ncbi:hypothetical protein LUZ60_012705 [Juncus effusus]|nr:hypothetical protein LUZ60_012705 [Juncus effusus]
MVSYAWAYTRIITGTILGGILGFYVMHRMEMSYKEKMKEQLAKYEAEMKRREEFNQQQLIHEEQGIDKAEILPEA